MVVLKITQRVTAGIKNIPLDIEPKSHKKINYNRRAHSKKGNINKIFTDGAGGYTHTLANCGTNAKHLPFYKISHPVHIANLVTIFSINKHFK